LFIFQLVPTHSGAGDPATARSPDGAEVMG
jgi:hypothetical protein